MRACALALLVLGLVPIGCSSSIPAETDWVHWLPYRAIAQMAVTSSGEVVAVGRSTSNETTLSNLGSASVRPFITRVAVDGSVVDSWTGFLGSARSVAVDDEGRAYVLLEGLRDDPDWSVPSRCELRAIDIDGSIRWSKEWNQGQPSPCFVANAVVVAADAVVVEIGDTVEAYELDGAPRWQSSLPPDRIDSLPLTGHGDTVWMTFRALREDNVGLSATRTHAWRIDALEGEGVEIELDVGELTARSVHAVDGGMLVLGSPDGPDSDRDDGSLLAVDETGTSQWVSPGVRLGPGTLTSRSYVAPTQLTSRGSNPWTFGGEQTTDPDIPNERYTMVVQRWTSRGEPDGEIRRSFIETHYDAPEDATPAELTRAGCRASDVERDPLFGSQAVAMSIGPDGSLWIGGQQGCRDAFVMRMEVK